MHCLAILSFFKETKIWNCPYGEAFAHSFKALRWGDCGFLLSWAHPSFFLTPSKPIFLFIKNLLKTGFVIETKYLKLVHGTVVNGVQGRMSLFITLPTPNF